MISGAQRVANIKLKVRLIADRNFRDYMAGKIDYLPAWQVYEELAREFDRINALYIHKRGEV